ncbi:hypothetical protein [Limnobacter sp.]|uniref:hypothetical protein n=1 Tax=Limnobacter sp. TaxID=2003368 RepID=UPI00351272E7
MEFQKLGLVFRTSDHTSNWAKHSALTPTPVLHPDGHIRVYAGFRDDAGVSRIGYVDLNPDNPLEVLKVSEQPVLDIGTDGCFDDNGVILGDVVWHNGQWHMFYVGFQLVKKAKFLAFTGLALADAKGEHFERVSPAPILGRAASQTTIGAVHTAMFDEGRWKLWFARGDNWEMIDGKPYPQYEICYCEASDLLEVPRNGQLCITPRRPEYRIGRPRVYKTLTGFEMYYTKGTTTGEYFPGKALSSNGVQWQRHDETFELTLSRRGWDSNHLCYPSLLTVKDKRYMFYNGNNMGLDGFGVAVADIEN